MLVRKQVDFAHVLLVSIACSLLAVTSATLSPGDAEICADKFARESYYCPDATLANTYNSTVMRSDACGGNITLDCPDRTDSTSSYAKTCKLGSQYVPCQVSSVDNIGPHPAGVYRCSPSSSSDAVCVDMCKVAELDTTAVVPVHSFQFCLHCPESLRDDTQHVYCQQHFSTQNASGCPAGWFKIADFDEPVGRCYYRTQVGRAQTKKNWLMAHSFCSENGGTMASINAINEWEHLVISGAVPSHDRAAAAYWLDVRFTVTVNQSTGFRELDTFHASNITRDQVVIIQGSTAAECVKDLTKPVLAIGKVKEGVTMCVAVQFQLHCAFWKATKCEDGRQLFCEQDAVAPTVPPVVSSSSTPTSVENSTTIPSEAISTSPRPSSIEGSMAITDIPPYSYAKINISRSTSEIEPSVTNSLLLADQASSYMLSQVQTANVELPFASVAIASSSVGESPVSILFSAPPLSPSSPAPALYNPTVAPSTADSSTILSDLYYTTAVQPSTADSSTILSDLYYTTAVQSVPYSTPTGASSAFSSSAVSDIHSTAYLSGLTSQVMVGTPTVAYSTNASISVQSGSDIPSSTSSLAVTPSAVYTLQSSSSIPEIVYNTAIVTAPANSSTVPSNASSTYSSVVTPSAVYTSQSSSSTPEIMYNTAIVTALANSSTVPSNASSIYSSVVTPSAVYTSQSSSSIREIMYNTAIITAPANSSTVPSNASSTYSSVVMPSAVYTSQSSSSIREIMYNTAIITAPANSSTVPSNASSTYSSVVTPSAVYTSQSSSSIREIMYNTAIVTALANSSTVPSNASSTYSSVVMPSAVSTSQGSSSTLRTMYSTAIVAAPANPSDGPSLSSDAYVASSAPFSRSSSPPIPVDPQVAPFPSVSQLIKAGSSHGVSSTQAELITSETGQPQPSSISSSNSSQGMSSLQAELITSSTSQPQSSLISSKSSVFYSAGSIMSTSNAPAMPAASQTGLTQVAYSSTQSFTNTADGNAQGGGKTSPPVNKPHPYPAGYPTGALSNTTVTTTPLANGTAGEGSSSRFNVIAIAVMSGVALVIVIAVIIAVLIYVKTTRKFPKSSMGLDDDVITNYSIVTGDTAMTEFSDGSLMNSTVII